MSDVKRPLVEGDSTDAPINDRMALWAAMRLATGISLTDEQADLAIRSLETNRWHLRFDPTVQLPERLRGDGPCDDCGTLDNIHWFTENVLWNAVTGEQVVHEQPHTGILCIPCFIKRADAAGLHPTGWRLLAEWPWRLRGEVPA